MSHLMNPGDPSSPALTRRNFLRAGAIAAAATAIDGTDELLAVPTRGTPATSQATFELDEATIASLQEGMRSGRYTSRSITELYLSRIDAVDRAGRPSTP
jgi:amidase